LKSDAAADLRDAASKFAICSLHAKKHQRKRARVAQDDLIHLCLRRSSSVFLRWSSLSDSNFAAYLQRHV
jgi:hypothetical protein